MKNKLTDFSYNDKISRLKEVKEEICELYFNIIGKINLMNIIMQNVNSRDLCYGNVLSYQGIRDLDDCLMFDKEYKIVRKVRMKNGDIIYKDVLYEKKLSYAGINNVNLKFGDTVFAESDSLDEYLDPYEKNLGKVKYIKLLDVYFEKLTFDPEYGEGKVLKFEKKNK